MKSLSMVSRTKEVESGQHRRSHLVLQEVLRPQPLSRLLRFPHYRLGGFMYII